MKPYKLIVDHASCWGCRTCEVACKQENLAPDGIRLIKVMEEGPRRVNGRLDFQYRVDLCRHCDAPPCVDICPEDAISQRGDGIVLIAQEQCSGCGLCLDECPYEAIELDSEQAVARKCHLCQHRVDHGLLPACADNICPGHCIYFGDPDDIHKEIEEKHRRAPRC